MSCTSQLIKDIGLPCWGIWAAGQETARFEGGEWHGLCEPCRENGWGSSQWGGFAISSVKYEGLHCELWKSQWRRDSSVVQLTWNSSFMWLSQCPLNIWSPCTPRVTILKLRELLRVSTQKWMNHVICWLMYPLIVWKGKNFLDWLPPGWLLTRWH